MESHLLEPILLLLLTSVGMVLLFRRLHLAHALGYLTVGMLVGPHALGWLQESEVTSGLAELGVVFLMFTIGLEFSRPHLLAMKGTVLGLGGGQVGLTLLLVGLVAWLLGVDPGTSFLIGSLFAMSSTAIVIKQLAEQLELQSRHGRLCVGVLLFQDLAVIPCLIVLPMLGGDADVSVLALLWALLKGCLVCVLLFMAGRWLLRPVLHAVARARSKELFVLCVLLMSLTAAWLTQWMGLSMTLGAFLAGMILGETEFRHQIEADIKPFQDILLGLFFVTIGMLVDFAFLWAHLGAILGIVLVLFLFKTVLICVLGRYLGHPIGVTLRVGLILAHGGEFSFVLLSESQRYAMLDATTTQLVLAAVICSMALAPFFLRYNGLLVKRMRMFSGVNYEGRAATGKEEVRLLGQHMKEHVLVAGFGWTGQSIVRMLGDENIPYIAFDLDVERVRVARLAGACVCYGDASRSRLLVAANIQNARSVIISFETAAAGLKTVRVVRRLRPDLPIIARARDDGAVAALKAAGATEVVVDTFEVSLMLSNHLLMHLGVPMSRIMRKTRALHRDRYHLLHAYIRGDEAEQDGQTRLQESVQLSEGDYAVGKSLASFGLAGLNVTVDALNRAGVRGEDPELCLLLKDGDVLVLSGYPAQLSQARGRLLNTSF